MDTNPLTARDRIVAAVTQRYPDTHPHGIGLIVDAIPTDELRRLADERRMAPRDVSYSDLVEAARRALRPVDDGATREALLRAFTGEQP